MGRSPPQEVIREVTGVHETTHSPARQMTNHPDCVMRIAMPIAESSDAAVAVHLLQSAHGADDRSKFRLHSPACDATPQPRITFRDVTIQQPLSCSDDTPKGTVTSEDGFFRRSP